MSTTKLLGLHDMLTGEGPVLFTTFGHKHRVHVREDKLKCTRMGRVYPNVHGWMSMLKCTRIDRVDTNVHGWSCKRKCTRTDRVDSNR